ncbi:TetR/AcrR family transcriptional regulator [Methylobacterium sp. J-026]|uniref:TetR/AcrR family transcriptional regulator n=1 Tax=Methylobacterium sp. J-026 TaxID=2836624 RepID=UPI001FB9BFE8|nr:TetR/AcrR family transcriptional regulator [Methylobacterium sp. J-026]MCJ2134348.1 TetR/AcrR family transcriptional regulator [Methylobacterium sp. J-026]
MRAEILPALAEAFRQHGYEGASLSRITQATGLGKGSLYRLFPGGKDEMAACVLDAIDGWFESEIFAPLRQGEPPGEAVSAMFEAVERYFRSGQRVCLIGVLALGAGRDRFGAAVRSYFARWIEALAASLRRAGHGESASTALAEEVVAQIQGAIVLARALDDPALFTRRLATLRSRIATA